MDKCGEVGLIVVTSYLEDISTHTNDLPIDVFFSLYCMLAEEYCRSNDLNILEFITNTYEAVVSVNEELGKY